MTSPASRRRPATDFDAVVGSGPEPLLLAALEDADHRDHLMVVWWLDHARQGAEHHHAQVGGLVEQGLTAEPEPARAVAMSSAVNAGMPAAKAAGSANNSVIAAWIVARASSPCTACLQVSTKAVRTAGVSTGDPQVGRNQTAVSDGSSSVSPGIEVSRISPAGIGTGSAPMLATQRTPLARE